MGRRRWDALAGLAAATTFWLLLAGFILIAYRDGGVDFRAYYAASLLARRGGNPYDFAQLTPVLVEITGRAGGTPYFYPPWFCVALMPLTWLSYPVARIIWLIFSGALFYLSLELTRRSLAWDIAGWRRWALYILTLILFAAYCLHSEQVGILLSLGLALSLWGTMRRRPALAGLGLIIALTKPQVTLLPLAAMGIWLLRRRRAVIGWSAAWLLFLTAGATLIIPRWWQVDFGGLDRAIWYHLDGPQQVTGIRVNTTLYDFLTYELHLVPPTSYILVVLVAAVVITCVVGLRRHFVALPAVAATFVTANLMLTPYTLQYDYPLLTVTLFWLLQRTPRLPPLPRWSVAASLAFSVGVLLWQHWSYEAYWMLLGIAFAFCIAGHLAPSPGADQRTVHRVTS